jgi:hypothetical protein
MTDHRSTLRAFLETDLHRLEATLDGAAWTPQVAERLTHHLRFAAQVRAVYLEGQHPRGEALKQTLEAIAPRTMDEALDHLAESTERLIAAIQQADDARLHAPVLDPHERGLTVLGHLYDLCRANAMLVEWANGLAAGQDEEAEPLKGWIEAEL